MYNNNISIYYSEAFVKKLRINVIISVCWFPPEDVRASLAVLCQLRKKSISRDLVWTLCHLLDRTVGDWLQVDRMAGAGFQVKLSMMTKFGK